MNLTCLAVSSEVPDVIETGSRQPVQLNETNENSDIFDIEKKTMKVRYNFDSLSFGNVVMLLIVRKLARPLQPEEDSNAVLHFGMMAPHQHKNIVCEGYMGKKKGAVGETCA